MTSSDTKSDRRIKYAAVLRRTADGVERTYVSDFTIWESKADDPMYGVRWHFAVGSFACDCNRHVLFLHAGGDIEMVKGRYHFWEGDPNWVPCGSTMYELVSLTQIGESTE